MLGGGGKLSLHFIFLLYFQVLRRYSIVDAEGRKRSKPMNEELERDRVALKARIAKHNEKEKRRHRICWLYAAINAVFAGLLLILFVRWGR